METKTIDELRQEEADIRLAVDSYFEPETFLRDTGGTWTDRLQFLINEQKAIVQLRQDELQLVDQRREDREQKKEDAQKNASDDMMDNMSDDEWLHTETQYAGMKMTGQQWRDFAKRNRLHQEESDAYALSKGATREGNDLANAALRVFEKDRADWTDEDKAIVNRAEQNPEGLKSLTIKKEWADVTNKPGVETPAARATAEDNYSSLRDSGINPNVDLKGSFDSANRPNVANADPALLPTPKPAAEIGGFSFG